MSGAHLEKAKLNKSKLSRANMSGANMSQADLRGADLNGAILGCIDLSGGKKVCTNLKGARYNTKPIQQKDPQGNPFTLDPTQFPQEFDPQSEGLICVDC